MKRCLLNLLTVLSLLMCGAVCVLWARAHLAAEGIVVGAAPIPGRGPFGWMKWVPRFEPLWLVNGRRGENVWSFGAGHGDFVVEAGPALVDERPGPPPALDETTLLPGLEIMRTRFNGQTFTKVLVPYIYPLALFGVWPAAWLISWRRRRRDRDGRVPCSSCGPNLTGNVSGVCPECGKGLV